MSASDSSNASRDERVNQVIADYLRSMAEGKTPDRAELLARHADLGEQLSAFFSDHDHFQRAAAPLAEALTLAPFEASAQGPSVGTRIRYFGDYELLEEIARGGMGVVYMARQSTLKRIVALKMILSGQLAGQDEVKRFYVEAEAATKLSHPNIVSIFEIGQHDGQHYFSMAFVEGESLAHKIAAGPLPPRQAVQLIEKVAGAVAYAHAEGVVHRDLKPANVLLDRDGEPHVTDFGLAKRIFAGQGDELPASLTQTGQVLGTPSYMPPEQAGGETERIGPLSDVYSLGAILYCLLTGRPPFQSASATETLILVLQQEPVSPRLLNPKVPRDLETICLKCLQKEPRQRYASAAALAGDLGRFLRDEPIVARPISSWERAIKWARRRPATAALLAAIAVAVLSLGAVITGAYYNGQLERSLADTQAAKLQVEDSLQESRVARRTAEEASLNEAAARRDEEKQRQTAQAALLEADAYRYLRGVSLAQAEWRSGSARRVEALLEDCPIERRNWEWRYLKRLCHSDRLTFSQHAASVNCVAIRPDGKRVASGSSDRTIKLWDPVTGRVELTFKDHRLPVSSLAFSPDGKRIVSSGAGDAQSGQRVGELKIWDATTGRQQLNLEGHSRQIVSVAFSSVGNQVASASGDQTVRVWDAGTGKEVLKLTDHGDFPWLLSVAFSPDGKWLASASAIDTTVWDAKTGRKIRTLDGHKQFVQCVSFSPDGKQIATADFDGVIKLWETDTGKELLTLRGHTRGVVSVAFSRDPGRLVTAGHDETTKVWDLATGQDILTLKGHASAVTSVQSSPDGKWLVSGSSDGTVKIWDATRNQDATTLTDADAQRGLAFKSPSSIQLPLTFNFGGIFSPQGDRIAWIGHYGMSVHVTGVATKDLAILKGHSDVITSMAFNPDGRRMATGSADKTIRIWDVATGTELRKLTGHSQLINCLAFTPDGTQLASLGYNERIKVWDVSNGLQIIEIGGEKTLTHPIALAFSSDRRLALSDQSGVTIWDASTGQEKLLIKEAPGPVNALCFSPDGKRLAGLGSVLKIWDVTSGREIIALKESAGVANTPHNGPRLAFNPDGLRLAAILMDQTVKVWDVATGELIVTFPRDGRTADAAKGIGGSVGFRTDGNQLFAGFGSTAQIWDATPISSPNIKGR